MKTFETRWQECAASARFVSAPAPEMPPGFAARVIARANLAAEDPLNRLWLAHARRALILATGIMVICAVVDFASRPAPAAIRPPIEAAVFEVMTRL